ncbi:hypothetical protein AVDCRST_MAG94-6012, partial [uncultured Leptolyngbya sp.]
EHTTQGTSDRSAKARCSSATKFHGQNFPVRCL